MPVRSSNEQQPPPSGGAGARGLQRDPALAALIDSVAFVRSALGPDSSADRARHEVLLAVAYSGAATKHEVALMLQRDVTTVSKQLEKLRRLGQLVSRPDPRVKHRLLWRLSPSSGHFAAVQLRAAGVSRAQLRHDTATMLHASRQMPGPALRVPPVRAREPARFFNGGGPVGLRSRREAGAQLKVLRENAGWTQSGLASAAGLALAEVRRLEGGLQRLDALTLLRCCGALGAQLADVVVA